MDWERGKARRWHPCFWLDDGGAIHRCMWHRRKGRLVEWNRDNGLGSWYVAKRSLGKGLTYKSGAYEKERDWRPSFRIDGHLIGDEYQMSGWDFPRTLHDEWNVVIAPPLSLTNTTLLWTHQKIKWKHPCLYPHFFQEKSAGLSSPYSWGPVNSVCVCVRAHVLTQACMQAWVCACKKRSIWWGCVVR